MTAEMTSTRFLLPFHRPAWFFRQADNAREVFADLAHPVWPYAPPNYSPSSAGSGRTGGWAGGLRPGTIRTGFAQLEERPAPAAPRGPGPGRRMASPGSDRQGLGGYRCNPR